MRKDVYRKMERFPKNVQEAVLKAIELLQGFPEGRFDIKKMQGSENIFRLRLGKYRFAIYTVNRYDCGIRCGCKR